MSEIISAIKMVYEIIMGAKSLIAFYQANRDEKWFQDSAKVMASLRAAKTEQEYKDVAKNLRDIWNSA